MSISLSWSLSNRKDSALLREEARAGVKLGRCWSQGLALQEAPSPLSANAARDTSHLPRTTPVLG